MFDFRKKRQTIEETTDNDYVDLTSLETDIPKTIEKTVSNLSSIQISIEFKERLKTLKGRMSYEEYIKKLIGNL